MSKEWFELWFDSPYYHILYQQHDEKDAQRAIDNLLGVLDLAPGARVLDLACGKGRHARYLAGKGFQVTGLDISASSIEFARQFEHDRLEFYQHDMRKPFRMHYFDAVLNFFTSFGYFANDHDHRLALLNIAKGLREGGRLMLDFFNSDFVMNTLVAEDVKTIDDIDFHVRKRIDNGYVEKTVTFEHLGKQHEFSERVRLLTLDDFSAMLQDAGMRIVSTFGGYDLEPFDKQRATRLIVLATLTS